MRLYHKMMIGEHEFIVAEKLDDFASAQVAAAEYRAEGFCCRVWPWEPDDCYIIWTGPPRERKLLTLKRENIRRQKNTHIPKLRIKGKKRKEKAA